MANKTKRLRRVLQQLEREGKLGLVAETQRVRALTGQRHSTWWLQSKGYTESFQFRLASACRGETVDGVKPVTALLTILPRLDTRRAWIAKLEPLVAPVPEKASSFLPFLWVALVLALLAFAFCLFRIMFSTCTGCLGWW